MSYAVGACPNPRRVAGRSHRCRSRQCPSCGLLWAGDSRRKLLANVTAYGGDVALVTVTAPGRDVLPDRAAMFRWNRSAPGRWRDLHRRAREATIRDGHRLRMVSRTWEYQRRGALHVHVVAGVSSAAELAGAHAYVAHLHRLRARHEFGFVDRGRSHGGRRSLEVVPAERAARYVAKYLSPLDGAGKPTVSDTVRQPDVPAHVIYVDRLLTQETGVTMRWLRHVRRCHFLRVDPETGELLQAQPVEPAAGPPRLLEAAGSPPDL